MYLITTSNEQARMLIDNRTISMRMLFSGGMVDIEVATAFKVLIMGHTANYSHRK